jgi:hypothetical protein
MSPFFQVSNERLPCPTQGEAIFSVHVVRINVDFYYPVHMAP